MRNTQRNFWDPIRRQTLYDFPVCFQQRYLFMIKAEQNSLQTFEITVLPSCCKLSGASMKLSASIVCDHNCTACSSLVNFNVPPCYTWIHQWIIWEWFKHFVCDQSSICLIYLSTYLSINLFIYLSVYPISLSLIFSTDRSGT